MSARIGPPRVTTAWLRPNLVDRCMLRLDELDQGSSLTFHIFLALDGVLDRAVLVAALTDTFHDYPLLASRIERLRFGYRRVAVDVDAADATAAVAWLAGPDNGAEQAFVRASLDITKSPPVALAVLGNRLVIKVHHVAMDGVGSFLWLKQLASRYAERLEGRVAAPPPPLEPTRSYAQYLVDLPWRDRLAVMARGGDALINFFVSNGTDTGGRNADYATFMDAPIPVRGQIAWQVLKLDAPLIAGLKGWTRAHGATMNDVLFAAFTAAAYARWPQDKPVVAHIPVNLRQGEPAGAFNRVADVRVELQPGDCVDFPKAFQATLGLTPAARDRFRALARVFERYGVSHFPRRLWFKLGGDYMNRPKNGIMTFDFSNVGVAADLVADFGPTRVVGGWLVGPQMVPPGLGCYITTFRGELALTLSYLTPCTTEDSAQAVLGQVEATLRELAGVPAAVGVAP